MVSAIAKQRQTDTSIIFIFVFVKTILFFIISEMQMVDIVVKGIYCYGLNDIIGLFGTSLFTEMLFKPVNGNNFDWFRFVFN
jgi:hypothetical protein